MPINLAAREWDEWMRKLKAFRRHFGHSRVPPKWPGDPGLAKWVAKQRNEFHRLPLDYLEELFRAGLDFGSERAWLSRFFELVEFKRHQGHCNASSPAAPRVAVWLSQQRSHRRKLTIARRTLLDNLGIDWSPLQSAWNKRYEELRAFKAKHGHCRVPAHSQINPRLAVWVANQRRRRNRLLPIQTKLLTRLGFDWTPNETAWENHLANLKAFKKQFGHCNIAPGWTKNRAFAAWIVDLRDRGRKAISESRRKALDAVGFEWTQLRVQSWEKHFSDLCAFKQKFGHCNVGVDVAALGKWASKQRARRKRLLPERRRRLDQLGFAWRINSMSPRKTWEERFRELVTFKKRFGNCDVPTAWSENKALAEWVRRQRSRDKAKLTTVQKRKLNNLGFSWNRRKSAWEMSFADLAVFKKKHGHCDVAHEQSPQLAGWVINQRYRRHTLSAERIKKLARLGFRWSSVARE